MLLEIDAPMNKNDKAAVTALLTELTGMRQRWEEIGSEVQELAEAEQEKFDNMNEGLQQSEQGQAIEQAASALSEAAAALENGTVGEAIDALSGMDL